MRLLILLLTFMSLSLNAKTAFKPRTVKDFYKTSVRIYNLEMSSGGTGSIFRSYKNASHILTNKHVCRLIEQGGIVSFEGKEYNITHYKKFKQHDLCLVRVATNLHMNLNVSKTLVRTSSIVYVSGHPNLLPHIVTKGHITDHMEIQLITGTRSCTKEEEKRQPIRCGLFGGIPIVETMDSIVVSNLIKPGSSGSAVFNTNGEIVGVVYAGSGRDFSYGFIVPHVQVLYFIQNAHRQRWIKVGTKVSNNGVSDRIFNYKICREHSFGVNSFIKTICSKYADNMIWSK